MKKAVKTSVWIVGGLLALLAAAALFIVLTFDPNKYKAEIAAAVSQATGRELTISGDIRLPLFPWLGVELGAKELSNAPVLAGFTLGGINLRDATLVFDDRAKPAHYELRRLNLHTGAVNLRDPVKLDLV